MSLWDVVKVGSVKTSRLVCCSCIVTLYLIGHSVRRTLRFTVFTSVLITSGCCRRQSGDPAGPAESRVRGSCACDSVWSESGPVPNLTDSSWWGCSSIFNWHVLRWPLCSHGLVQEKIVFWPKIHQSVQKDFISLSLTSSQRHKIHFFNAVIAFFRSVNNLDAEGLSLLSREEQRIHTKHTNGNLTANCFNSQNENQPPHCRLNGFSAALKTRPRASSLLWADPSQTATPLLRISSEGAKIKRALFCCYCVCRVVLDFTFIEAKHSHKQSAAERNWILISVSGQFLFALLSDVMRNVRRPAAAVQRQRFSEMFIMFGFFCFNRPEWFRVSLGF